MKLRGEIGGGAVCALFAVVWIATALGLPYMGEYAPGSGFLPLWLGICLLGLSLLHLATRLRDIWMSRRARVGADSRSRAALRADAAIAVAPGQSRKVVAVTLGLLVCVALIERLGFVVAVGAYLVFLLRGVEKENWPASLGVSCGCVAVLFALFRLWLHVPLPKGPWGF